MSKRLERTPDIEARLRAAFGPDADISRLAVFEFVATNLNPLRKSGGIYENARFTMGSLNEMMAMVSRESVQLITNHNDNQMPIGRVFAAETKDENLHVLAAINEATHGNYVSDVESGVIDQVSVSVLPRSLICSECGFDYLGDEATIDNWWDLMCNNGHQIGVDGAHVRLAGIASWTELSLVGMGAVPGARSVPKDQSAFGPRINRLAASGVSPSRILCCASRPIPKEEKHSMNVAEFTAELAKLSAAKATADAELVTARAAVDTANTALTAANTALEAANTKIAELEAAAATAPKKPEFDAVLSALTGIAKRAFVALKKTDEVPTDPTALVEATEAALAQLSAAIPVGPTSQPSDGLPKPASSDGLRAFVTAR